MPGVVVATFDVVLTLFLPLLTGGYLAFVKSPAGLLRHPSDDPGRVRGSICRVRVALVAAPLVWQPMVGTQLLVERLFGVLCVLGIGMLLGTLTRFIVARLRRDGRV
ncbi:hypothetical protein [Streptomyces sp. NBC_01601]|uniref:hypothetical protein n=1 Tax=Streptomyces sp. NBC_01601 TaxID=2975892 RepID=UPI002E29CF32|nr:hypothetical protein [Streptomyces sp. NBC_01601]